MQSFARGMIVGKMCWIRETKAVAVEVEVFQVSTSTFKMVAAGTSTTSDLTSYLERPFLFFKC